MLAWQRCHPPRRHSPLFAAWLCGVEGISNTACHLIMKTHSPWGLLWHHAIDRLAPVTTDPRQSKYYSHTPCWYLSYVVYAAMARDKVEISLTSRSQTRLSCNGHNLPSCLEDITAEDPQGLTCSLSSAPWPGTPVALLLPRRLPQRQTNILRIRKPFWFWSTIPPCLKGIRKFNSLPFLVCRAPSPLPRWVKHGSPAPPPTTKILPVNVLTKPAAAWGFLFFVSDLAPPKEALRCNSYRDAKEKRLFSTPLLQGQDGQSHFLYHPFSEKSKEDNHTSLPLRPSCDPFPTGSNSTKWLSAGGPAADLWQTTWG